MKTILLTTYDKTDPVYVVASRILSVESYTANWREGAKLTLDGGEEIKVNEHVTTVNKLLKDDATFKDCWVKLFAFIEGGNWKKGNGEELLQDLADTIKEALKNAN